MPFVAEIAAIFGPVGGLLLTVIVLRFIHFEKAISDLQDKVDTKAREIDSTLNLEIKKKEDVSVDKVKRLVNMLSSLENKKRSLERLENQIGAFRFDFISIGLLVIIIIIGAFAPSLDTGVIFVIASMTYFIF